MNTPAKQDIDSGTQQVVTPGEPVDHVDNLDGQSAGHHIEPEGAPAEHQPGMTVDEKPPGLSRDDIYSNATQNREDETAEALANMTPEERAAYDRMILEAAGQDPDSPVQVDPYDGDHNIREGYIDPNDPSRLAPAPVAAAPAPGQPAPQPGIDPNAETVTIVVYGERREVPRAEVDAAGGLANYQKDVAADEKMKRASTYEASVRTLDQQVSERLRALQTLQAQPPATVSTVDPELPPTGAQDETGVDVETYAAQMTDAFYTGDREQARTEVAAVLRSFKDDLTRTVQPVVAQQPGAPSASYAEQQAAQDRANAQERDRLEANQVFVDEFSDLSAQVLRDATYAMVQTVAAEPIMYGRPLAEITREAGTRVRSQVFGANAPAPAPLPTPAPEVVTTGAPAPVVDLAGRMALKRRTVVQPLIQARGRFVDAADAEQTVESNSEYIARMKVEQRGQGV